MVMMAIGTINGFTDIFTIFFHLWINFGFNFLLFIVRFPDIIFGWIFRCFVYFHFWFWFPFPLLCLVMLCTVLLIHLFHRTVISWIVLTKPARKLVSPFRTIVTLFHPTCSSVVSLFFHLKKTNLWQTVNRWSCK